MCSSDGKDAGWADTLLLCVLAIISSILTIFAGVVLRLCLTFRRYVELLCFDGFINPTLRRPEPYIFAQVEGRRGFIKPDKLARLLPYR